MLVAAHLFPELLNLYGDRGNIMAFIRRCEWRGITVTTREILTTDSLNLKNIDFLFIGGGSDREQKMMVELLKSKVSELRAAIDGGLVILAVCGGFQMLGQHYQSSDGVIIPGLGLLDFFTRAEEKRLVGDCAVKVLLEDQTSLNLVGFENHAGRTSLEEVKPFGKVLKGFGNNGEDGLEGAQYNNLFCTYLHGPLLPKNPKFADYLISLALENRGAEGRLVPLDDTVEILAHQAISERLGFVSNLHQVAGKRERC